MSKEHETKAIRWVCRFLHCNAQQTGIVPIHKGKTHKLRCAKCGAFTPYRNAEILTNYPVVTFKHNNQ